MKKIILLSIIATFFSIHGYSQTESIVELLMQSYIKFYELSGKNDGSGNQICMEKPADFYDDFNDKDFDFSRHTVDKNDISYSFSDSLHPPLRRKLVATSEFGSRILDGKKEFHRGIDLRLTENVDTVHSVFCGTVRFVSFDDGFGNFIIIKHYNGIETLYAHLSEILVIRGEDVAVGDPIGIGGNTGRSTGAHLHFEVQNNKNPRNPRLLLKQWLD
ncbi:MAG: M23 family metallopeptidase [Bacteroidales bacterium]|jgi:murein DD-endopeptidase MepM/ murein hydrolase activator NlpD|nr:M23 family metallopeptidase [Bacteroidales bacterium]